MQGDNSNYFSIARLQGMNLPGFPDTRQGWDTLVKREKWSFREVKGLGGPGGVRREYLPPPNVLAVIGARQPEAAYVVTPVGTQGSVKATTITPDKEWLVRAALFAGDAEWMRGIDSERKARIVLEAFRLTLLLSEGDEARFALITSKPDAILSALRLAYEMDCMGSGVAPGSDDS